MEINDTFIIDISLSHDTRVDSAFFLTKMSKIIQGKIHVIDYQNSIRNYLTIKESSTNEFIENTKTIIQKLIFPDIIVKDVEWIQNYISQVSQEDLILINGAERLIDYQKSNKLFSSKFGDKYHAIHLSENEDWKSLISNLDKIYYNFQKSLKGIISIIYTDIFCKDIIIKLLSNFENMTIVSSENPNIDYSLEKVQHELLEYIGNQPMEFSLNAIQDKKNQLGEVTCDLLCAVAYYKNGNIHKSVELYEKQFQFLNNNEKLFLANMYIDIEKKSRAEEILVQLEKTDRYLNNLYTSFLRLYDCKSKKYEYWLNIAINIEPNNIAIMELYASFLSSQAKYFDAASEFRKLSMIINREFYELVARINEIIGGKYKTVKEIKNYIYCCVGEDPDLKNEAVFRLANYFEIYRKSDFLCYGCLCDAVLDYNRSRAKDIVIKKLDILGDENRAAKALGKLKPYNKENDAKKITKARTDVIIASIQILAGSKCGYLKWRQFLKVQQEEIWFNYAYEFLKKQETVFRDIDKKLETSYIYKLRSREILSVKENIQSNPEQTNINLLKLLSNIKMGNVDITKEFETTDMFVQSILTPVEVLNDWKMRIICRYYLSVIFTNLGKHQEANNQSLSILEFYNIVDDEVKTLSLYLWLMSWGYSQYRIGRKHEGILCILASIKYCELSGEITPFIEEGVNIISRFFSDCDCISGQIKQDEEMWITISNSIYCFNPNMKKILNIKLNKFDLIIEQLLKNIKNEENDWEGDLVNLVAIYANNNKRDEAVKLIMSKGKIVANLLNNRKDIRYEVLYNWAWILFGCISDIENRYMALHFIELAYQDIEEKRQVSHKEERGALGEAARKILKLYLDICCCFIKIEDNMMLISYINSKIDEIITKLSPRSIIEQKKQYKTITDKNEYLQLEQQYQVIYDEYQSMLKNGVDVDMQSQKAMQAIELQNKLKEKHPCYMELKEYDAVTLNDIKEILDEKEIVYINLLTKIGIYELIISHNNIERSYRILNCATENLHNLTKKYSEVMQEKCNMDNNELNDLIEKISNIMAELLLSHIRQNEINTIYYVLDYGFNMFSFANIRIDINFLIEKVNSLIRIIDITTLLEKKKKIKVTGLINRCIGKNSDSSISMISKHLNNCNFDKFITLSNDSDNISNINETLSCHPSINTVIIYGHGLSDPVANNIIGAFGIEGQDKVLDLDDIIQSIQCENIILISCSSGTPNNISTEESDGTWTSLLERFNGNFITCKWDVDTGKTLEILDYIIELSLNQNHSLDEALIISQKKMINKYQDAPQFWAGFELWVN